MGYSAATTYTDNYYYSWIYYDYRYVTTAYTYGYDIRSNGWKVRAFARFLDDRSR